MDKIKSVAREELLVVENRLSEIVPNNNVIMEELNNFISGSSKRIRSLLAILYIKSFEKNVNSDIITVLIATELIHDASLLHDDVIDNAQIRRGKTTIAAKFSQKASILSGDYLLSVAVKYLLELNNSCILELFLKCTKIMSESEISQLISINSAPNINEYLKIINGKTAELFSVLLKSCAILLNLNSDLAEKFGRLFGLIFQINNDENKESALSDTENGVKTIVNISGIEKANSLKDNYLKEIRALFGFLPDNSYSKSLEDLINLL